MLVSISVSQFHNMINPAAPKRDAPAADWKTIHYPDNLIDPPCLGEALRRVTIVNSG